MPVKKIIIILFLTPIFSTAQNYTLSGYIKDAKSGETLIGAGVFITNLKSGTVANTYGFYSISISKTDTLGIVFSFIGYKAQIKNIKLDHNISLDILMEPSSNELAGVIITAEKSDKNITRTQMGVIDVPMDKIEKLPAILGAPDVLKLIQLLPGVSAGQEGTTGFFVRGGNADQNLVQLDEAVVYNPNHLFGLFSTFNERAINKVTLIKGGFPAQYGGRLSSIVDITMKEGNNQSYHAAGGIGLSSADITIEGPIVKNKGSFIVSYRRTYLDLILKGINSVQNRPVTNTYNFYDLNVKLNYILGKNDRIFLSFFKGKDNATYTDASSLSYGIKFGNGTGTLRWNHLFSPKLFCNTSLIYDSYLLDLSSIQGKYYSQFYSSIKDITAKTEFQYFPNPKHTLLFGFNYTYHEFSPSGKSAKIPKKTPITAIDLNNIPHKYSNEFAAYINDEINISEKVGLNLGVRFPAFVDKSVTYTAIEPRVATKYVLNESTSIKAAYTVMNQYLHIVPSATAALPTDIWISSSLITKPQHSQQASLGLFKNFKQNNWETSVEVYYKNMQNQVAFKEGTQILQVTNIDSSLVFGKGWSYGAEFYIKKNYGKLNGWISYTLSWTNQKFPDLNYGNTFPFKYDRRHNIAIVGIYDLNKKWSFSAQFILNTGNAYTLPAGRANVNGGGTLYDGIYYDYTERNNARLNLYHRLDISATRTKQKIIFKHKYEQSWVFSIYNLYSHQNPYFVYLTVDPATKQPQAKQVSLLPIIPSVSFNFKF